MAAKAESIADGNIHFAMLRHIGREIQRLVDFRVGRVHVNRGGHQAILDGQDRGYRLNAARATQQVARHALGRRDVELGGVLPKYGFNGLNLSAIAERRAGSIVFNVGSPLGTKLGETKREH